jgi:hypothetical protein
MDFDVMDGEDETNRNLCRALPLAVHERTMFGKEKDRNLCLTLYSV